ncbi:MAG: hypothetical protein IIA45_04015 [Bacteroidetes bacterium]|nr:hypothetical protein [Bacteroidota bacterium]
MAQTEDSATQPKIDTSIGFYTWNSIDSHRFIIDTSINLFHHYNPLDKSIELTREGYIHLGNLGTPHTKLLFDIGREVGFDLGVHHLDRYEWVNNDIMYYDIIKRFTEINYIFGLNNEEVIDVFYTQNLSPTFNFGFNFNKTGSEGFFANQATNHTNLVAGGLYRSLNKKYSAIGNIIISNSTLDENGGVRIDSFLYDDTYARRNTVPVNLAGARFKSKKKEVNLKQSYYLGHPYEKKINDSLSVEKFLPTWALTHTVSYTNRYHFYQDSLAYLSGIYPDFVIDSFSTFDSLHVYRIKNELGFKMLGDWRIDGTKIIKRKHGTGIKFIHEWNQIFPYRELLSATVDSVQVTYLLRKDTIIQDLNVKFYWQNILNKKHLYSYRFDLQYGILGYSEGDYRTKFHFRKLWAKNDDRTYLNILHEQFEPAYLQKYFLGNHYKWDNNFSKTTVFEAEVGQVFDDWDMFFDVSVRNIDRFVYNDTAGMPAQLDSSLIFLQVRLMKNFEFRGIHWDNYIVYQRSSNTNVIHLPPIWSKHSLYYENYFFKKVLYMQMGFDITYHMPYYANAYAPSTGLFYLQNEQLINSYPVVDFFVNFRVSNVRIFFRTDHLDQGLFDKGYFEVPHYPMPDLSFRGGLSWRFVD